VSTIASHIALDHPDMPSAMAQRFAEYIPYALKVAEAYGVTAQMVDVVQAAAAALDEEDVFDRSIAPTQCGWVVLDNPLPLYDVRGSKLLIHGVTWSPASNGVAIGYWNDTTREADEGFAWAEEASRRNPEKYGTIEQIRAIREKIGRFALTGMDLIQDGKSLGPSETRLENLSPQVIRRYEYDEDPDFVPLPSTNPLRYVWALWLLQGQTITEVRKEEADRAAAKRAKRMNMPSAVTVIALRRKSHAHDPGETNVEWHHRWLVRGHWRWNVCGEHHPLAQEVEPGKYRARLWVTPYIKGPDDAPLVVSQKIYRLSR
jgi:hypothetical protein